MGTEPEAEDIPEITPEMIRAGAAVLFGPDCYLPDPAYIGPTLAEELARKIPRQALKARQSQS